MLLLRSGYYADILASKYRLFKFEFPKDKPIKLGKKCTDDVEVSSKPKTIKDFLS